MESKRHDPRFDGIRNFIPFQRLVVIIAWVILDCLLSWSWVIIPGGGDMQRAWHAIMLSFLVLGAWPMVWYVARKLYPPIVCAVLSLPLAHASFFSIDWPRFALSTHNRPAQAWALINVFIAGAFLMTSVSPRVSHAPTAMAFLFFGALYSLLGPLQYWICGPSTIFPLCHGYLAGHLPQLLTSIGLAALIALVLQAIRGR